MTDSVLRDVCSPQAVGAELSSALSPLQNTYQKREKN